METPLTLLKRAAYEQDLPNRTDIVVQACKVITDILPFATKSQILLGDPELAKFLLICIPFNSRSIEWLISSMIEKFKFEEIFLKFLWTGLEAIAALSEKEEPKEFSMIDSAQLRTLKKLGLFSSWVLNQGTEEELKWVPNKFCAEIKENKDMIKMSCLDLARKLCETYFKDMKEVAKHQPDVIGLYKEFITNTNDGEIITKAVEIAEKLRKLDGSIAFDNSIDEVLYNKKDIVFKKPAKQQHERKRSLNVSQSKTKDLDLKDRQKKKPATTVVNASALDVNNIQLSSIIKFEGLKRWNSTGIDAAGPIFKEADPDVRERVEVEQIEKWLAEGEIEDVPEVLSTVHMKNYLSKIHHLENLLTFIFEPDFYPLAACWKENFSDVLANFNDTGRLTWNSMDSMNSTSTRPLKSHEDYPLYILRSFKTMKTLCDKENSSVIVELNKENLEIYFRHAYHSMGTRSNDPCNYNHVGMLTESFVRRESEICIGYILHYNLLYKFVQNIEFPLIQNLLLTLFKSSDNTTEFEETAYRKLLQYCLSSSFFPDLGHALLEGWKTFEEKKFTLDYKPPGVQDLVSIALEQSAYRSNLCESLSQTSLDSDIESLMEEVNGFKTDIDGIRPIIQSKKEINKEELIRTHTYAHTGQKVKCKSYSKFPSLTDQNLSARDDTTTDCNKTIDNTKNSFSILDIGEKSSKSLNRLDSTTSYHKNSTPVTGKASEDKTQRATGKNNTVSTADSKKPEYKVSILKKTGATTERRFSSKADMRTGSDSNKTSDFSSGRRASAKVQTTHMTNQTVLSEEMAKKFSKYTRPTTILLTEQDEEDSATNLRKAPQSLQNLDSQKVPRSYFRAAVKVKAISSKPIKRTLQKEFDEGALDHEQAQELDKLYPSTMKAKSKIELEASKEEYHIRSLKTSDKFSLALCEFIETLFRKALSKEIDDKDVTKELNAFIDNDKVSKKEATEMKRKYLLKRMIGRPETNFSLFWQGAFSSDCALFENLLKNYLFKIKMHHFEETGSGYVSGTIVNLILEECLKGNLNIVPYTEQIRKICKRNFSLLCKTIVQSHAWVKKQGPQIYLQDFEVKNPIGSARLLLAQTLKLFIENDHVDNFTLTKSIDDTCWHVIILWFFTHKTNNMYHQMFYTIVDIALNHNSEDFLLNILVKLGLISSMYKTWSQEICQNSMIRNDTHVDSIVYHLKKLVFLIDSLSQDNPAYNIIRRELKRSMSWKIVRSAFIQTKGIFSETESSFRTESKERSTFSTPFASRQRWRDSVMNETLRSKTGEKDKAAESFDNDLNREEDTKVGNRLKEIERELCN